MDIFSVQDAGSYQMLYDECTFLCSTVIQSLDQQHAVTAASDLLFLLSGKRNRRTLFGTTARCTGNRSEDDHPTPLQAVLGVFAWAKTLVAQQEHGNDDHESVAPSVPPAYGRSKVARKRQLELASDYCAGGNKGQAAASPATSAALSMSHVDASKSCASARCQQLLDAIGMCLYFVALDCTLSDDAASSGSAGASKAARRIRKAILTNSECLQGILCMVLADPMTRRLRGTAPTVVAKGGTDSHNIVGMSSPIPCVHFTKRKNGEDASIASTPTSLASPCSAAGTPDSQCTSGSIDPTVAGRRIRKRRCFEQQQADTALDTIPERDDRMDFQGRTIAASMGNDDDKLSFASESPLQRKPYRGRGEANNGDADDLNSVASSTGSQMAKASDQLDQVTARILGSLLSVEKGTSKSGPCTHTCGKTDQNAYLISSYVPLIAITRIISGKCEGSEKSSIDDELVRDEDNGRGSGAEAMDDDEYNPLLETNRILGENGAIPLLSQALAETLTAVTRHLEQHANPPTGDGDPTPPRPECQGCLAALQDRVSMLVSLVDGASLLSESNRQQFCEEGFTTETGGFLIVGLIAVLRKLLDERGSSNSIFEGVWGEITLATLRMLTSLTHENKTAAKELEAAFVGTDDAKQEGSRSCGLDIVARILREAVRTTRRSIGTDGKLIYDSVIFCLNILANVVESGGSRRILSEMSVPSYDREGNQLFLSWLTRWLVGETHSFREAVTESTFGTSMSNHEERKLDAHEDEKLVTAGNGFVLLSCLLVDENDDEANADSSAYKIILSELSGDDRDAKMSFLKNTLKAFCNFYHYSIGELSVAIVAPVKLLIKRLELIQEKRRRLSLGC
jgi:hypothetical protein